MTYDIMLLDYAIHKDNEQMCSSLLADKPNHQKEVQKVVGMVGKCMYQRIYSERLWTGY